MENRMLIIGGYGKAGSALAGQLASQNKQVQLVIGGRDRRRAEQAANALRPHAANTVSAMVVDATDDRSLYAALESVRTVVVAAPGGALAGRVAKAAVNCQIDYFDLQLVSPEKTAALRLLESQIEQTGLTFVTDCGLHPGLPALLARYAGARLPHLWKAEVFCQIRNSWESILHSDQTATEFLSFIRSYQSQYLEEGRWKNLGWFGTPKAFDFGPPFGRQACAPMWMDELTYLPAHFPRLRSTGFFIAGFNPAMYYLHFPLVLACMKFAPGLLEPLALRLLRRGLAATPPPYGVSVRIQAEGEEHGKLISRVFSLYHPDRYQATAIPAAACLQQYLHQAPKPGLWLQGWYCEPEQFFRDMAAMGFEIQQQAASLREEHVWVE